MKNAAVLDTCAVLWMANGDPLSGEAVACINRAQTDGDLLLPTVCLWEIATLAGKGRIELADPQLWLGRLQDQPGLRTVPLSAGAAVDAALLPGTFPKDPADRMIVATARELGCPVVTRDRKILAYGAGGYVRVVAA